MFNSPVDGLRPKTPRTKTRHPVDGPTGARHADTRRMSGHRIALASKSAPAHLPKFAPRYRQTRAIAPADPRMRQKTARHFAPVARRLRQAIEPIGGR